MRGAAVVVGADVVGAAVSAGVWDTPSGSSAFLLLTANAIARRRRGRRSRRRRPLGVRRRVLCSLSGCVVGHAHLLHWFEFRTARRVCDREVLGSPSEVWSSS